MDGALLLDKPVGVSSNRVLQDVKRIFCAEKAGHAGTLDPLASGLLVVLFGEATKFAGPQLDADKEYLASLKLGERTSTADAEGRLLEKKAVEARLRKGQALRMPGLAAGIFALLRPDGSVIGLGKADAAGALKPLRLTATMQAAGNQLESPP